jgi:site-specific DNA-methyltransferase (adenine-specific)
MNPPYGRNIGAWVDRLVEAHAAGAVPEAVALVPARVDTAWWRRLASSCALVLFFRGRLRFVGNEGSAPFPSALVYLGRNHDRFLEVTNGRGDVWQMVYSNAL